MNARKIILPLLLLASVSAVQAQKGQARATLQYNVGLPTGSFNNSISETSLRGFKADVLFGLSSKLAIGVGTGFQDFYQKDPRQVYKLSDGSDVSAVLSQSIQTLPLLATAKYSFAPGAAVQPYAAVGVGGNLVSYSQLLGEFGSSESTFGFAARPEAGVYVPFKKGGESGLSLSASYSVMPFNKIGISNLNHLGLSAGVSIPLRK